MTDALRALPGGRDAVLQVLPAAFNWPLFSIALVLMATPVAYLVYREMSGTDCCSARRPQFFLAALDLRDLLLGAVPNRLLPVVVRGVGREQRDRFFRRAQGLRVLAAGEVGVAQAVVGIGRRGIRQRVQREQLDRLRRWLARRCR